MSLFISIRLTSGNKNFKRVCCCEYYKWKRDLFSGKRVSIFASRFSTSPASTQQEWPDLAEICRTGNVPKKFNFATHVFDKHVKNRPSQIALWFDNGKEEKKITYEEFCNESIRAAVAIQKLLDPGNENTGRGSHNIGTGVNKSPVLFAMLPAVPEWWFLKLGCIRSANIFCPGTVQLSSSDIRYRLQISRAKIIATNPANMDKVDEAERILLETTEWAQPLKKIVVGKNITEIKNGWISYEDWIGNIQPHEISQFKDVETNSEDLSIFFFTSGTTGNPKMVAHTYSSYGIGHYKTATAFKLNESDVFWSPNDPGWAKNAYCNFYASLITGNTVYVRQIEKLNEPMSVLEILRQKPITVMFSIPTLSRALIQIDGAFNTKALRGTGGGAEAVNPEIIRAWKEKTGHVMLNLYGQTECTATYGPEPQKEGSFGNPSSYDIRIVSDEGEELKIGEEGNIAYKIKPVWPVGLFKGYLIEGPNGPQWDTEKHKKCFVGDYYLSGDKGYKDNDGDMFFISRADDVISSAGYRIGPFEVESALQTHPAVVESAVVASPDALRGEVVKAFVVLTDKVKNKKDLDKNQLAIELQNHVKSRTAPYKYPRKVEFVDSLPKTVSGKTLRRELKRREF